MIRLSRHLTKSEMNDLKNICESFRIRVNDLYSYQDIFGCSDDIKLLISFREYFDFKSLKTATDLMNEYITKIEIIDENQ